ncbi:MAG: cyclin-dependent kinase inhibitor 3 family protein [Pirellulales bacterium]
MTKQLIKTSVTDPLRINWLEFNNHWGRIGMTLCPGKKQQNAISGNWYRDLVSDVMTIAASGARHVISLIDINEMAELQVLGLQSTVEGRGMKWHHFPIPDFGVPPKSGNSSIENIVTTIVNALNAEEDVVIHCKGGLGRTGTVVATFLSLYGMRAKQSLDIVRSARPGAVQTIGQAEFVHNNFRSDGPMVDIDVKISTLPIRSEITGSASLTKAEAVEGLLITLREQLTSGRFPEASKSAKAVLALDDKNEEAKAARQAAADARGSWNENPEEDGFWISPDRSQMEVFGVDLGRLGPENDHNFGSNVAESENDE